MVTASKRILKIRPTAELGLGVHVANSDGISLLVRRGDGQPSAGSSFPSVTAAKLTTNFSPLIPCAATKKPLRFAAAEAKTLPINFDRNVES